MVFRDLLRQTPWWRLSGVQALQGAPHAPAQDCTPRPPTLIFPSTRAHFSTSTLKQSSGPFPLGASLLLAGACALLLCLPLLAFPGAQPKLPAEAEALASHDSAHASLFCRAWAPLGVWGQLCARKGDWGPDVTAAGPEAMAPGSSGGDEWESGDLPPEEEVPEEEAGAFQGQEELGEGLQAPPPGSAPPPSPTPVQETILTSRLHQMLERHVAYPGASVCGAWGDEYTKLHRDIRSGAPGVPRKYFTFDTVPDGPGMGDKLNGVISAFLVALVTRRAFILANPRLAAALGPAEIDWHVRSDVPIEITTQDLRDVGEGSVLRVVSQNGVRGAWPKCPDCGGMVWDFVEHFEGTEGASNIILGVHHGILVDIFNNPGSQTYKALHAMGIRLNTAHACILRLLFRPRPAVERGMLRPMATLRRPGTRSICIHARTEDGFAAGDESPEMRERSISLLHILEDCAEQVQQYWVPSDTHVTWFVMSDSQLIKDMAKQARPDKVLTTRLHPKHVKRGKLSMWITTAIDWYLFSMCDFYVVAESGMSKTAYVFNLKGPPLYMFSRLDLGGPRETCVPARFKSLTDLGDWSGL